MTTSFPLFESYCFSNATIPDEAKGGLDLSSYTATMTGGSGWRDPQSPADPDESKVYLVTAKMRTEEPDMPPER